METRNQAVDREIVPQRLMSLPSSDLKRTDALQWVLSLGWDRVQEDKNVGRGPHTEMALKWGQEAGSSRDTTHPTSRIRPLPVPDTDTGNYAPLCSGL